jgi:hypothetical protein
MKEPKVKKIEQCMTLGMAYCESLLANVHKIVPMSHKMIDFSKILYILPLSFKKGFGYEF